MKTRLLTAWSILLVVSMGCGSGPSAAELSRKIKGLQGSRKVGNETLAQRGAVDKFYEGRDARSAWVGRADDIVEAIRGMEADGLDPADYHLAAIEVLMEKGRSRTADEEAKLERLLADAVARMADDVRYGRVKPSQVNPAWNADPRDDAPPLETIIAEIAKARSVRSAINAQRPHHFIYQGLVGELAKLRKIEASGGWPTIDTGKGIRPGARDRRVAAVRRRLIRGGDLRAGAPRDSTMYDNDLVVAVKTFQARHRIEPDGVIGPGTVKVMNVPVTDRILQVRANLERARWVLRGIENDFMLVNLPAFKAYLIRDGRNAWESRTQIGEEAMQTPSFRATIRTVVFNPDWSVPSSIVAEEILPDMRAGNDVIAKQKLVVYDASNNPVDPSSIDWGDADSTDFPYSLKQPPSDDNALGQVKFLFPNKYAIYLHDTPNRRLFDSTKRTFSHGCIRIENPLELAALLLQGQSGWNAGRVQEATAGDETQNVDLTNPIPIMIVYWTVSVGAKGEVRYADDIYDLDKPLVAALERSRG